MKNKLLIIALAVTVCCLPCSVVAFENSELRIRPAHWAQPVIGGELENFYKIDDKVYRSEQPDDDAFEELERLGVKEVLNLRNYHNDDDEAEHTDIKLHKIAMNAGSVTEEQIIDALQVIKDSDGPIVFHCWHGSDRTGAVAAAYRVVFQDWNKADAIDELRHGGYGYHSSFYPNIVKLIENLDIANIKSALENK